ncbi:MAG TPA: alpha/beta hydrolase [Candidatus Binataceae bacterium]|jgi:pimeloyl-ACP methyl ester carboxylesterase|nr:alpha/beta hydrolase [Candidatus Binataceae bacterium]
MAADYERLFVTVGGAKIEVLKGGRGRPLVALHSIEGSMGWQPMHQQLAAHFTVYVPTHPGYAGSERPPGLESFIDLARFYPWILQELNIGKATLAGHFVGGWLAGEIAVMCPEAVEKLVLIDSAGIKPRHGEIADIFLHGIEGTRALSFHDVRQVRDYDALFPSAKAPEERERQTINREATTRYCWKPYVHDPILPLLMCRLRIPTLIVWGREDRIVPLECAESFHAAIANSRLTIIDECGHFPHFERPEEFNRVLSDFLLRG